ncbi:MAG: PAS domain S-box protein [Chlamydiota bacterium]
MIRASGLPRRLVWATIACSVLIATLAGVILYGEYQEQLQYWRERLIRIADVNQLLLQNWSRERREDAQLLASFRSTEMAVLSSPDPEPGRPSWQQRLQEELVSVANTYSYEGAYILNISGQVVARSDGSPPLAPELTRQMAFASQAKILTLTSAATQPGYPRLAFIHPIHARRRAGVNDKSGVLIGCVALVTRPETIASLLLAGPRGTTTGETVLAILRPKQLTFISPLRHWKQQHLQLSPGMPAQLTLLEKRAFFGAYPDYRGVSVLVATRYLPELGWAMVTKVDRRESLAAFQQTLILGISVALLAILFLVSLATAWSRHQRVQHLQSDLARGKQTEENLRRSEERFWVALDNSPVVVFNQDRELRYTWINKPDPPWSEVDYLGKTDEEIIGVADGSRLSALKRPVLESGIGTRKEWSFVYRGQRRDFDINIQPLRNQAGDIVGITCASTDITERKRVEQQLKDSEKKYRRLFEATEAFAQADMARNLLEFNPAFQHMLGYSAEELVHLTCADLTPARWLAVEEQIIEQQVLQRGYSDIYEKEYRRKDGTVFPVELQTFLIRDDAGQPVGLWAVVRDITERKRAEERLREYEKVVEGLEEMIVVVDRDYRYLIANRAFLTYRGLRREQLIGQSLAEVLNPGVFENFLKAKLDRCLEGHTVIFEMRYNYPHLGERDLLISYFPIEGRNGVDRIACVLQDITDRKRAEEALRDSETRYRLLFEHNPAGMFRCTPDGKMLEVNDAFARIYGYTSRDEVLRFPAGHFYMRPEEREPLVARLRQQGGLTDYEFCGRHRDGTPVWVLANIAFVPGQHGADDLLEGTFINVTRRKNAEAALQRSEAQLRAFIDNAPYGIFRYAGDHFLSANPALIHMLGYTNEAEVLALSVSADVFDPSAEYRDLMALSGQQLHFGPVEAKWRRRDGTPLVARLRGRVAQNGKRIIEAIAEDITQQRALEEHLGQSDRLEALGRLASGVAHDINNLLLGVTLNLEHAAGRAGPPNSSLQEDIQQALQAATGAAAVIRQLLVFGRKRSRQQQAVNLNDVIIRSLDLVHHLAGEKIHVNLQLGQHLGLVTADPIHVQQVVLNLVANARDAMAGQGQIKVSTRNIDLQSPPAGEYFTAAPQAGNYVVLEVSDTGAGISREALAHIFEPFYTTKKEGSGLGLSTSYGIVTQNSGYMSVRTELGHGTAVRSYLPRLAEPSLESGLRRVS